MIAEAVKDTMFAFDEYERERFRWKSCLIED
jgi:hypothetical protein